ncbi:MAG: LptF/LptG family permease [Pseudomonadales bacterium]
MLGSPSLKVLDRYVFGVNAWPFVQIVAGLVVVYLGYVTSIGLAYILAGDMDLRLLGEYLFARTIIATEVIVPVAAFMAVVLAQVRLHRDREAHVFYAAGISPIRLNLATLTFSLLAAVLCFVLTVYGRPWAYQISDRILSESLGISIKTMQPRVFYDLGDGLVLMGRRVDRDVEQLTSVFVSRSGPTSTEVLIAKRAEIATFADGEEYLKLDDVVQYEINVANAADVVRRFRTLTYRMPSPPENIREIRRNAQESSVLRESNIPADIAEYQWRVALPLILFFMTLTAIRIGRTVPGHPGTSRIWYGLLIYICTLVLASIVRAGVTNNTLNMPLGIFSIPAIFALLTVYQIYSENHGRRLAWAAR